MPKANDKDVYYFSHDCNARNDDKMLALRSVYGLEGYAIYFMLIEILREQPSYKLPITKYTFNTLAMQMQCKSETVENVINDCCDEFKNDGSSLLTIKDGFLYSDSLLRRMIKMDSISETRAKAASTRWEMQTKCKSNANAEQKQCNKKKIKEKKIKENKEEIKEKEKENTPTDFSDYHFSESAQAKISTWLTYKHERKEDYKPTGKKTLITRLQNNIDKYGEKPIMNLIDESMSNNWKGIIFDKLEGLPTVKKVEPVVEEKIDAVPMPEEIRRKLAGGLFEDAIGGG